MRMKQLQMQKGRAMFFVAQVNPQINTVPAELISRWHRDLTPGKLFTLEGRKSWEVKRKHWKIGELVLCSCTHPSTSLSLPSYRHILYAIDYLVIELMMQIDKYKQCSTPRGNAGTPKTSADTALFSIQMTIGP